MNIESRDILTVTEGFIVQQVNCRKVMGAGLAKQIKLKWPAVEEQYLKSQAKLGDVDFVSIDFGKLWVANLYGQDRTGAGLRQTNYGAVSHALAQMRSSIPDEMFGSVYFPWGMGAGLGGGSWEVISELIEFYFPEATICRKE